ncbi:MAG: carbonic anhydrase [Alphaproteobacteria bacterium]|nr:carbonic anhydrase [Alphaproteobacteria bacterium]
MQFVKNLVNKYQHFLKKERESHKELYRELAQNGQKPEVMLIGCSDSRVPLEQIFNVGPGEVFTVRNVAALVPPDDQGRTRNSTAAALEYAVEHLKVKHIVVVGHSQCGGVAACTDHLQGKTFPNQYIDSWVAVAKPGIEKALQSGAQGADLQLQTEQNTIRHSLQNLMGYDFIAGAVKTGELEIHGAYFDIEKARLFALDQEKDQFVDISYKEEPSIVNNRKFC